MIDQNMNTSNQIIKLPCGKGNIYINTDIPTDFIKPIKSACIKVDQIMAINHNIDFKSMRATKTYGICTRHPAKDNPTFPYTIKLTKYMVNNKDIENTVIHELLHSFPDTFDYGHKGKWLERASRIKDAYGIEITRTSRKELSVEQVTHKIKYAYDCECALCGRYLKTFYRKPKWAAHGDATHRGCGGKVILIQRKIY